MSPEEQREDDIFEVEDVDDTPPPEEFKRPKGLLGAPKKAEPSDIELKSGAAKGAPPPLVLPNKSAPGHKPPPGPPPRAATPRPTEPSPAPKEPLEALAKTIEKAKGRPPLEIPSDFQVHTDQQKATRPALKPIEGEVDVRIDQSKAARPALQPLEGPVEIVKPASEAKPKVAIAPVMEGDMQIVKDVHAKTPQSERLKVAKPVKVIGIVDTTFARYNMGAAAADELQKLAGDYAVVRRTVPGIKDLAVECKILLEEEDCDLVIACGMVGGQPIDKQCAHEASLAIQWAMLATNRHILEVFVHEDEASDAKQLAWLMDRRTREHAENAHWMVQDPRKLQESAGKGLRQGFDDAGPVSLG